MGPMGCRATRQAIGTPLVVVKAHVEQPLVRVDAVTGDDLNADTLVCALNDMARSGFNLYEIFYFFHRRSVCESLTSYMMDLQGHQRNGTGTVTTAYGQSAGTFAPCPTAESTAAGRIAPHPTSTQPEFSDAIRVESAK